jgi:hypothetical protein
MTDTATIARRWIAQAVTGMTGNTGDPHSAYHDPLEALTVLGHLRAAIAQPERAAARRAREDGQSWHAIGEALGFADDPGPGMTSIADRAFLALADRLADGPSLAWSCSACGGLVRDRGPAIPLLDAERGHAEGCARLAAAMAAWDAQWADDDG